MCKDVCACACVKRHMYQHVIVWLCLRECNACVYERVNIQICYRPRQSTLRQQSAHHRRRRLISTRLAASVPANSLQSDFVLNVCVCCTLAFLAHTYKKLGWG